MTLHKATNIACSAFITACNPFRHAGDVASNANRQQALARELSHCSLVFICGIGQHPSNRWPGEASYRILGLSLEAAKALVAKYEQTAIVWSGADAKPQLILLRRFHNPNKDASWATTLLGISMVRQASCAAC
ncbi:DUF3293 domain-containing protein [Paraburkholderia sacchari]|uniref:DUF3293 domain-containing protein n=1 Tax=Paraburkholderia sacchari TaxID=159450 RepID=UPI0031451A19